MQDVSGIEEAFADLRDSGSLTPARDLTEMLAMPHAPPTVGWNVRRRPNVDSFCGWAHTQDSIHGDMAMGFPVEYCERAQSSP